MALITWKANFDSSWSGATNWDTSTVPTSVDYVRFDNTSVKNCIIDVNATVTDVSVAYSYTGNISWPGKTLKCYNYRDYGTGGNRDFGDGLVLLTYAINSTELRIGSNLGTIDASSCALDFTEITGGRLSSYDTYFYDDYGCTFKSFRLATNSRFEGQVPSHFRGDGTIFTLTANSLFRQNQHIYIEPTSSGNPFALTTTQWFGYSDMSVIIQNPHTIITFNYKYGGAASSSNGGKIIFTAAPNVDGTYVLSGAGLSIGDDMYDYGSQLHICAIENNSSILFDTSGRAVNTEQIHLGSSNPTASFKAFFRNSTVKFKQYQGMTHNVSGDIDFGASIFTTHGVANTQLDFTHGTNHNVNAGTFTINMSNGGLSLESYGKPFYNITHTAGFDGGFRARGNFTCNDLYTQALGGGGPEIIGWDSSTAIITAMGNVTIDPSVRINMADSSIIMKGPNKTFLISDGNTFIQPYGTVIFDNTGMIFQNDIYAPLKKLVLRPGATVTHTGGTAFDSTLIDKNVPLIIGSDATLTSNTRGLRIIITETDGTFIDLPQSYALKGNDTILLTTDVTGQCITSIPSRYRYTGTGSTHFHSISGDTTVILLEDYTRSSGGFGVAAIRTGSMLFNTNNYNLKVNAFTAGCSNAAGKFTSFYGSSLIDCSTYSGAAPYNTGTIEQNYNTSTIQVGTNFTHGSNHVIDPGTSLFKMAVTGTGTLTTAGKPFYDVSSSVSQVNLTGDLVCNNLVANGNFIFTAYRMIAIGNVSFNGVSNLDIGDIYMLGSSPTLLIKGAVNEPTSDIAFDCTGDAFLTMTYAFANYGEYGALKIGPSAHVTHTTAYATIFNSSGVSLFLGDNAWYTLNTPYNTTFLYSGTGGYPLSLGTDTTWDGNGLNTVEITGTTVSPALISGINYSGTGGFNFKGWGLNYNPRFTLAQDMNIGTAPLTFSANISSTAYHMDVSTAGYSVTCGNFTIAPNDAIMTYFFASNSDFSVGSFTIGTTTNPKMRIYLSQSNWICDGSWAWGRLNEIAVGTSNVTFTGNGGISALTGGSPTAVKGVFNNVIQNSPGKTRLLLSDTSFNNYSLINGNYDQSGVTTWFSGDASFGGSGNLHFGERIYFSHNTANFEIASTIGDITGSSCDMTFTGSYPLIHLDHDATFERLYIPSQVNPTLNGSKTLNLCARTLPLRMDQTATLNINAPLNLSLLITGNPLSGVLNSYTITGDSTLSFDSTVASTVVSIPSMVWGQYLSLAMRNNTPGVSNTIQLSGDMTCKNLILNNTNTGTLIFTPQTYGINAQSISFGGTHASGTLTTDFSAVNVRVHDVNPLTFDLGTNNIKFNRSKWTCTGDWIFRSSHNTIHAWDTVTFIGDGTVTSNGEYFNWLYLHNETNKLVLADNLTCREYKYISGTLDKNGKNFSIASDYIEIMTTE